MAGRSATARRPGNADGDPPVQMVFPARGVVGREVASVDQLVDADEPSGHGEGRAMVAATIAARGGIPYEPGVYPRSSASTADLSTHVSVSSPPEHQVVPSALGDDGGAVVGEDRVDRFVDYRGRRRRPAVGVRRRGPVFRRTRRRSSRAGVRTGCRESSCTGPGSRRRPRRPTGGPAWRCAVRHGHLASVTKPFSTSTTTSAESMTSMSGPSSRHCSHLAAVHGDPGPIPITTLVSRAGYRLRLAFGQLLPKAVPARSRSETMWPTGPHACRPR